MSATLARPRIGLLAGGGRFPFVVAEAARRQGAEVVCVALRDHADPEIKQAVDRIYWMGLGKLGRMKKTIIAVEAIEGTDRCILRGGELCPRGGFTVVKVAKPQQDMRFDVPTVGPATIASMKKAGASVLAIEADKTIFLDAEQTIAAADQAGIAILALREAEIESLTRKQAG